MLSYDLEILPIFVKFNPHAELEIPLEKVDRATVEAWLDDRLIEFAQTYVTIHFTDQYHHDHMASDPVANVRFPKVVCAVVAREGRARRTTSSANRLVASSSNAGKSQKVAMRRSIRRSVPAASISTSSTALR